MRSRIWSVGSDGDVVFGEIDAGFEQRDQLNQLLLDGLQATGKRAFELLGRDSRLVERLRLDQVADGLGLGEVEAAVKEGAHGEFAGLRQARAAFERQLDDVPQDHRGSVGGDFDDVVGGVGVRLLEVSDDDFVDAGGGG